MSLLWRNKQVRIGLAPDRIYITGARSVDLAANDGSWNAPVEALAATLAHSGIAAERFRTLKPGQVWEL